MLRFAIQMKFASLNYVELAKPMQSVAVKAVTERIDCERCVLGVEVVTQMKFASLNCFELGEVMLSIAVKSVTDGGERH